jgi:5'-AMP-activated protein kinase catalytic alpha subunit
MFIQIAVAVRYCHKNSIIHRDIKLDNVLLDDDDVCKLCDFGVSRSLLPHKIVQEQCGTPAYLAPEIVKDEGYSGFKADVWSLGVLLYVLVSGIMPFRASTVADLNKCILKGQFTFVSGIPLSSEIKDLISKMLTVNVEKRIDSSQVLSHKWFLKKIDTEADKNEESKENLNKNEEKKGTQKNKKFKLTRSKQRDEELLETAKLYEDSQLAYLSEPKNRWNQFVIKRMEIMGFPRKLIIKSLENRLQNHVSACYYSLEKDYL